MKSKYDCWGSREMIEELERRGCLDFEVLESLQYYGDLELKELLIETEN